MAIHTLRHIILLGSICCIQHLQDTASIICRGAQQEKLLLVTCEYPYQNKKILTVFQGFDSLYFIV